MPPGTFFAVSSACYSWLVGFGRLVTLFHRLRLNRDFQCFGDRRKDLRRLPLEYDVESEPDESRLAAATVRVAGMPPFSVLSEANGPAITALRDALDANTRDTPDALMFMQTGPRERVYFLRSALVSVELEDTSD